MSEQELVPVFQSMSVGQAEVVRASLEESGIRCFIENENQAGFSGAIACRLLVQAADAEAAHDFIRNMEEQSHAATGETP